MSSEKFELALKVRAIAEDLLVHLYAPPYTIDTLKDFLNETRLACRADGRI